jgi:signal transduction histidine kinase
MCAHRAEGTLVITNDQLKRGLGAIGFALAYVALEYVSFVQSYRGFGITPWNPPPGATISFVYFGGSPAWALVVPLLSDAMLRWDHPYFLADTLGSGLANTVYVGIALWLRANEAFSARLQTVRDVLLLIAALFASALVATMLYTLVLLWTNSVLLGETSTVVWRHFVGDLIGSLLVVPLVLSLRTINGMPTLLTRQFLAQLVAIVLSLAMIFLYPHATTFQLFYLLFMPLLWVALTGGVVRAVVALSMAQVGVIIGSQLKFGSSPGLTALQALMIALTATVLIVGAFVTERDRNAERLRQHQMALQRALRVRSSGEVAAAIAHELNQPMTAIATYAGLVETSVGAGNWDAAAVAAKRISAQVERATGNLRAIRDLLQHGIGERAVVDVRSLVERAIEMADSQTKGDLVQIVLADSTQGAPNVLGDETQLRQAVFNVIANAIDATMEIASKDAIVVRIDVADRLPRLVNITVSDGGTGFPPDYDVEQMTPFITTKTDGTGLGLQIVRTVTETHGGRLHIKTSSRGAAVSISLPLIGAEQ